VTGHALGDRSDERAAEALYYAASFERVNTVNICDDFWKSSIIAVLRP